MLYFVGWELRGMLVYDAQSLLARYEARVEGGLDECLTSSPIQLCGFLII